MNEITKVNGKGLELTKEKIDLIRRTVAKNASDDELAMYLHLAKTYELDPFLKEICFIKRKVYNPYKQGYDEVPTIMVTRDGHMAVAHKSGQFGGIKTTPNFDEKGNLVSATCIVWNKSCAEPIEVTVYLKEYCAYTKDGKAQALWGTKPITMLSKVAESQALRKAFNFHGMYAPEEMESEIQKDVRDDIEQAADVLQISGKIHASQENYDEWREKITTEILDEIALCDDSFKLDIVKKKYTKDIETMLETDRAYILERFDSAFQALISDESEREGEEGTRQEKVPPQAPNSEIRPVKESPQSQDAILEEQEAFGTNWLPKAIKELEACATSGQITLWKNKNAENRLKLLQEHREYLDAFLAERMRKFKGK